MKNKLVITFVMFITSLTVIFGQNEVSIWVDGACGMCKDRIETAANTVKGVRKATWDVQTHNLKVIVGKKFDVQELHKAMAEVGHDTELEKAVNTIYDNLPGCCQYRVEKNTAPEDLITEKSAAIWVNGACGMCQDRIEKAAMQLMGVESASWDNSTRILTVQISEGFNIDDLHTHIASVGHDTGSALADHEVYEELPACCEYRASHEHDGPGSIVQMEADHENHDEHLKMLDVKDGHDIHGIILENTKEGKTVAVIGATIKWQNSQAGTSTDADGYFHLDRINETDNLVISYVGYASDTINMKDQNAIEILMKNNFILDEISIVHRKKSTEISFINTMKVQQIGQKELLKAACCSLSESFETTPSVDVSFTDAITGTRKIELLGLAGPYVQIMRENMPYIRGLAAIYGFSFTPGPWIESMQLNMGSGSVVNGPESMTGQINVEIKKPSESERLFINAYANQFNRLEFNLNGSEKINNKWGTAYLLHASNQNRQADIQNDGFMDAPISTQFIAMNRWKYTNNKGLHAQVGIKGTYFDKTSGQINSENNTQDLWLANVNTQRLEGWFKMGKVFEKNPNSSLGFQFNTSQHVQDANFGSRVYDASQTSMYSNLIFQTALPNDDHRFKLGASMQYDGFDEMAININYVRDEFTTGLFTEYHLKANDQWDFIVGLRGDYNNYYGTYVTPRIHVKYSPNESTAFRLVAGKGQRTATIFAENIGMFASNRAIIIQSSDTTKPYGLDQEIAWNSGVNITKEIIVNKRSLVLSGDYYYTYFINQVVFDYDHNPQEVLVYNLDGESFSHSVQAQADYEIIKGVDVRLAYRFNDVQTDYQDGRLLKPLISKHRAFFNLAWEITKGWNIDGTLNYQGSKRIPNTSANPVEYQFEETSPSFFTLNGQVSKFFKNGWEFYLGAENILNYVQERAILSPDNPDSPYFDSSLVWGPIMGRNMYAGFRYRIF